MGWSIENVEFRGVGRNELSGNEVWLLNAQVHPFHELIVVMKGGQYVRMGGKDVYGGVGDVLLYPAGAVHKEWTEPGESLLALFVSFAWDPFPAELPLFLHDTDRRVRTLVGWMHDERQRESPVSPMLYQAHLHGVLAELVRLWRYEHGGLVAETRHHVRTNIESHIDLDQLAKLGGMSKYHFVRKYKALTGRTPMEDVRTLRLDYARDMILTTPLPLKEIAEQSGLGDVYHMSRLFRRCLGFTPGSLRRASDSHL
ncbi:helix-turn-helix domain-containing protein [Verrucomicrobiota bacterium]